MGHAWSLRKKKPTIEDDSVQVLRPAKLWPFHGSNLLLQWSGELVGPTTTTWVAWVAVSQKGVADNWPAERNCSTRKVCNKQTNEGWYWWCKAAIASHNFWCRSSNSVLGVKQLWRGKWERKQGAGFARSPRVATEGLASVSGAREPRAGVYTRTSLISPLLVSNPLFSHQILGNGLIKLIFIHSYLNFIISIL